jgi:parvulin-like peptidyl-prolyl isomerase
LHKIIKKVLNMMKKLILLGLFATLSFARMIGGVAMLVDGMPITTFEIKDFAQKNNLSIDDATNALVQQKLAEIEIAKLGITASQAEVDNGIAQLAKRNNLDLNSFKKQVEASGKTIYELKQDIAKDIEKEKLYQKILAGSIKKPTDEDLRRLYDQHSSEFNIPTKVDVIQYVSNDKERLRTKLRTPAFPIDGVAEGKTSLPLNAIPPELAKTLIKTRTGRYTPILGIGGGRYVSFKVLKKHRKSISFEEVKPKLMMAYINERRQAKLIEYFEKKKSGATIKIIRKP